MANLKIADLKKTIYYLKRNGVANTLAAVQERLAEKRQAPYSWIPVSEEELAKQREAVQAGLSVGTFSIVVPTYRTPEMYLRRMIDSVLSQTYGDLELVLADATDGESVQDVVKTYTDSRIRYVKLSSNEGIAPNTNQGLKEAGGSYIGLLDHDDVLTPNALYEMAVRIKAAAEQGIVLKMLYSDEDKCNGDETEFFDPHYKEDFNVDLLISNNYICHLTVMESSFMKELQFRKDYDGAQDFDLVLRATAKLWKEAENKGLWVEQLIAHVPKVLYHWRCHTASTAENPQSKLYAYEAGGRAIADFAKEMGWQVHVEETKHLGFYRMYYVGSPFAYRKDVGAIGGKLVTKGKIVGGRMDTDGKVFYENLPERFSGYMHRASLTQTAQVLDIRNLELRPELFELFTEITGVEYKNKEGSSRFDYTLLPENTDYTALSIALSKAISGKGYRLLYLPERVVRL